MNLTARKLLLLKRQLQLEEHLLKLGFSQDDFDTELKNRVTQILDKVQVA